MSQAARLPSRHDRRHAGSAPVRAGRAPITMARLLLYTPRTIALVCELVHPAMTPDPLPIQRVHNQLYQTGDPPYQSFAVTGAGAVLSNPVSTPGASSLAAFLPDRFQFREELSS